jgi:hypothetical protein
MPFVTGYFGVGVPLPSKEQQGKQDAMMRRILRRQRRLSRKKR